MSTAHAIEIFKKLDKDGNGTIDKQEYIQGLKLLAIPKKIAELAAEQVFARFDQDHNAGIDQEEFVTYIAEFEELHNRVERAQFERIYYFCWAAYFILVGTKFILDQPGNTNEAFGCTTAAEWHVATQHVFVIVGFCFVSAGVSQLLVHILKLSGVAVMTGYACFWFWLTLYETTRGSVLTLIHGTVDNCFNTPPLPALVASGLLACMGFYGIFTGSAKLKED